MPQQLPDGVEVDAGHDQPAGEVVPHIVPPEALDARVLQQALPRALAVVHHAAALGGGKHQPVAVPPRLLLPGAQGLPCRPVQGDADGLAALGARRPDGQDRLPHIEVAPPKGEERTLPDPRVQRHQDHGLQVVRKRCLVEVGKGRFPPRFQPLVVSGPLLPQSPLPRIKGLEEPFPFLSGEVADAVIGLVPQHLQPGQGIGVDDAPLVGPVEGGLEGSYLAVDGGDSQPALAFFRAPGLDVLDGHRLQLQIQKIGKRAFQDGQGGLAAATVFHDPGPVDVVEELPQGHLVPALGLPIGFLAPGQGGEELEGSVASVGNGEEVGVTELMVGGPAVRTPIVDVPGFFAAGPDIELEAARGGVGIPDAPERSIRLHG